VAETLVVPEVKKAILLALCSLLDDNMTRDIKPADEA
jgi:hypothetical protein